jgi:hypothetical protein
MLASKESNDNGGVLADIVCMGTHTHFGLYSISKMNDHRR